MRIKLLVNTFYFIDSFPERLSQAGPIGVNVLSGLEGGEKALTKNHYNGNVAILEKCLGTTGHESSALHLADMFPCAAIVVDAVGSIEVLNAAAEKLLGIPAPELINRNLEELIPARFRSGLSNNSAVGYFRLSEIRSLEAGTDIYLRRGDNEEFPARIGISRIETSTGESLVIAIVEISSSNRDINADKRLALIVESADDVIISKDLDGIVTSWNQGAERLYGYRADEIIGQSIFTIVPVDRVAEERRIIERIRQGERVDQYETVRRRKDGQIVSISLAMLPINDIHSEVIGAAKVGRDVTGQKSADDRFRRVVEAAPNAMLMVSGRGEIVLVNVQTEKTFGYSREELIGQSLEMLVPRRYRDTHRMYREQFYANPVARPMGAGRELFGLRKDGSEFPVEIGLTPLFMDDGLYVMSAFVDISERKRAEEQRRVQLAELAHAGRLSAVGETFSELAHEINQPLGATANYIRASLRMMQSGDGSSMAQIKDWIEKAAAQTTRTIEIVQRVRSFVKKGDEVRANVNINDIIKNVIMVPVFEVLASVAYQPIRPQLKLASSLPAVNVDRIQIEQVILNLIRNGVEAMAGVPEARRELTIQTQRVCDTVMVSISDTGTGMTDEQKSRLFTPFYTTKKSGMGIGLSISKTILEAHAGTISVESIPGKGTTFSFSLPAVPRT